MTNAMKLCITIASCISAPAHCAEKKITLEEIILQSYVAPISISEIPQEIVNQMSEQQQALVEKGELSFPPRIIQVYVDAEKQIPEKIISMINPQAAVLAREHNRRFQLPNEQPK
jgi:hypothetical protein